MRMQRLSRFVFVMAPGNNTGCAAAVRDALTLGTAGKPFVMPTTSFHSTFHGNVTDPHFELRLGAFLVARNAYAYFGTSDLYDGLANPNIDYPQLYLDYGTPVGDGKETGPQTGIFKREWTKASVTVDCNSHKATITPAPRASLSRRHPATTPVLGSAVEEVELGVYDIMSAETTPILWHGELMLVEGRLDSTRATDRTIHVGGEPLFANGSSHFRVRKQRLLGHGSNDVVVPMIPGTMQITFCNAHVEQTGPDGKLGNGSQTLWVFGTNDDARWGGAARSQVHAFSSPLAIRTPRNCSWGPKGKYSTLG